MPEHSYGWLSVLPPVVAILLAILTRRILLSLMTGVLVGSWILADGDLLAAVPSALESHLWPSLADEDHLRVFVFTLLMGAMVGLMRETGAMDGIVRQLRPLARSRRGGQLTVWGLGLIVFFDDYANSLLLGNTMRPLTDRLGISREKLAYLVDSTAAPVSGLALVSTWVAGEIGFIRDGFEAVPGVGDVDGFGIFVETIPYRFYVLWALIFVVLVGALGRDFGPMRRAEGNVDFRRGRLSDESPLGGHWYDALLPILVVVGVTVVLILITGSQGLEEGDSRSFWNRFGNGDSYLALVYGSLAGLISSILLARLSGADAEKIRAATQAGAVQVIPALAILWLAWALSGLTGTAHLDTGGYLGGILEASLDPRWMPTVVFVLASAVAFSTGTSWGTMGILMPLVITVTYRMLEGSDASDVSIHAPLLIASIGSVLAGAIFGDHCSPISDTTVLSSQASGCDHLAHVWTQMPYAVTVGIISIVCGTLPVGFGIPVWLLLPVGVLASAVVLLILGRAPHGSEAASG